MNVQIKGLIITVYAWLAIKQTPLINPFWRIAWEWDYIHIHVPHFFLHTDYTIHPFLPTIIIYYTPTTPHQYHSTCGWTPQWTKWGSHCMECVWYRLARYGYNSEWREDWQVTDALWGKMEFEEEEEEEEEEIRGESGSKTKYVYTLGYYKSIQLFCHTWRFINGLQMLLTYSDFRQKKHTPPKT